MTYFHMGRTASRQTPPAAVPDPWWGIRSRQTLKTLSASREGWTERKGEEEEEEKEEVKRF